MRILPRKILSFLLSDEGATAIEYGLIAGGIALAIVAAVFSMGTDLKAVFNTLDTTMQTVASNAQTASSGG
ncbi:MAG TPA: Flp family type IVb pilin [Patescibacteria group bacterium]|jgi:pilus assembly protein Flp/PilA|nr:Flp family type IVb pilin [Patescibacteria group bacterium]